MYLVREVLYCKPGKVRPLLEKFKALSAAAESMGYPGFRLYTDVSGERFWTLVAEFESETLDGFQEMEEGVMASEDARAAMAGYHDLVIEGRREVYKVET
jgi:heme-degrading monooxygenase HmoA